MAVSAGATKGPSSLVAATKLGPFRLRWRRRRVLEASDKQLDEFFSQSLVGMGEEEEGVGELW